MTSNHHVPVGSAVLSLLLAACGGDSATDPDPEPVPVASIEVTPTSHTLVALGATQQFQAVAKGPDGSTISGRAFTWTSLDTMVATVSSSGLAAAVRNGTTTLRAATGGVSGDANVTVSQQQTALVMRTQPAGAAAGTPFTAQPVVEVHDARGNVASNDDATVVTVALATGGGALTGTTSATAVAGVATFTDLAVEGSVGGRTLTFAAPDLAGVSSASFTLGPGAGTQLVLAGGNDQTGRAATALPQPLTVKASDAFDNGVPAVAVTWAITSGSGILSGATSSTNASGIATAVYTLGRYAGVETVTASVADLGGSPISFNATATPNGTISGTITLTNTLLSPPATTMHASRTDARAAPTRGLIRPQEGPEKPELFSRNTRPAGGIAQASAAPEYVPDELIVTFRPGPISAPPVGARALASASTAAAVARSIRQVLAPHAAPSRLGVHGVSPAILAARVKVADPSDLQAAAARLRADPAVATVERNAIVRLDATARRTDYVAAVRPNDPYYPLQAWHYAMIDAPEAWQLTSGDAAVLVAVVDDGVRFDHPGIAANLTSDGFDFVSDVAVPVCAGGSVSNAGDGGGYDADPTQPAHYDFAGGCVGELLSSGNHGLHVAGTIGAVGNDAAGGTGVNWSVRIRAVRTLGVSGSGNDYDIAQGILYAAGLPADDGASGMVQAPSSARVINLSLGSAGTSTVLEDAVTAASDAGALLVAAAGNSGTADPHYPAAYSQTVSVSALGPDAVRASYSSFGSTVDITAPGGDDVASDATSAVWSTAWDFAASAPIWAGYPWAGTSMAAPHVSGVAGLLLAHEPTLTAAELRARLVDYAVDIGTVGRDDLYGHGIVNARNALTQSLSPPRQLFARLFDATTGDVVRTAMAQPNGTYAFDELPDRDYVVFAGQDVDGDGIIGVPTRRWGALGGSATPATVTVDGAGTYDATFSLGWPIELEPNDDTAGADALSIGGYLLGTTGAALADADVAFVIIPTVGQYTFETVAFDGACGLALEEDTVLQLYDDAGVLLVENNDVDAAAFNYCSRITSTLSAGIYYVATWGLLGNRRYAVVAHAGT
jgi:subtilisin family serine protease